MTSCSTARRLLLTVVAACVSVAGLTVVAQPALAAGPGVTRSGWQMYIEPQPRGFLSNGFSSGTHGDPGFYVDAQVPAADAEPWQDAPDTDVIGFDGRVPGFGGNEASRLYGFPCLAAVDYTFFQTLVTVPAETTVDQFSVDFNGVDDGARISVYNATYPDGLVVPGSYVYLGADGTSNLAQYLAVGANRVVITQLDDCATGNNLREARITVNSTTVEPPAPAVVAVTGVADDAVYDAGAVPAPGCSVTDRTDGQPEVAPVVSAVTGPRAEDGLGDQTVTCSYTNTAGLSASESVTYAIADLTGPGLTVPDDVVAEASGPDGAAVTFVAPTATDVVDGAVTPVCDHASGDLYPLGATTVTCTATDEAANATTDTFTVTVADSNAPTAVLSSTSDPSAATVTVDLVFSEPVTGLELSDLTATGGTLSDLTGRGTTYAVTLGFAPGASGATVGLPAGAAQDASGNPSAAAADLVLVHDGTAPTLTVARAAGQADPVRDPRVVFTVTADEPVGDLLPAAVTVAGGTGADEVAVLRTGPGSFAVAVTGMQRRGDVRVSLPGDAVRDAAGNGSTPAGPVSVAWTTTYRPNVGILFDNRCVGDTGTLGLRLTPDAPTTLTVTSSNPTLVPPPRVVITGRGDDDKRLLMTIRPVAGRSGTALVAVTGTNVSGTGRRMIRVVVGTDRADRVKGSAKADVVFGLGGDDTILGAGERDLLCGGGGDDLLVGGDGRDALYGGSGDDVLRGGLERDRLVGGPGRDVLMPGPGRNDVQQRVRAGV